MKIEKKNWTVITDDDLELLTKELEGSLWQQWGAWSRGNPYLLKRLVARINRAETLLEQARAKATKAEDS